MLLDVLRHGLTEANHSHRFNGTLDDPLTAAQVAELERTDFDASGYDAVFCSPLLRAEQTARCLGVSTWRPEPRLAERNLGVFEGLTAHECRRRYPEDFAAFEVFDAKFRIPGGESRAEHVARVRDWLRDARRFERVIAVTHGGTVDFLYRMGTGQPMHGGSGIFGSDNAALSTFEVSGAAVKLLAFNQRLASAVG